eukprot:389949_1
MLRASIVLLALIGVSYGARTVKVSVSNCTQEDDESVVQKLMVAPSAPKVGQNFTISGDGIPKMDVPGGWFNATAQWIGIPIYRQSGDACAPDIIKLPLDVGEIYYGGTSCPLTKGVDVPVIVIGVVHPDAPDATVNVKMWVTDSS